jgi:hypothetical protein
MDEFVRSFFGQALAQILRPRPRVCPEAAGICPLRRAEAGQRARRTLTAWHGTAGCSDQCCSIRHDGSKHSLVTMSRVDRQSRQKAAADRRY